MSGSIPWLRTETLTHRITYAPPPLESKLRMETSHTMHFCDGTLLASFDALGSNGVAVNASNGNVAFAPGPRGLRLVALEGALGGGDHGTDGG